MVHYEVEHSCQIVFNGFYQKFFWKKNEQFHQDTRFHEFLSKILCMYLVKYYSDHKLHHWIWQWIRAEFIGK